MTMFISRVVPCLSLVCRATGKLQNHRQVLNGSMHGILPTYWHSFFGNLRNYSTAADNTSPPRWVQLEPELEEVLVPRKLSLSPLESWLCLRYSLPPLLEAPQPLEEAELLEEKTLPPLSVPLLDDRDGSTPSPLSCKNVLEIRRRKMNRHKYKKLMKRTKFLRKRVLDSRGKRKQRRFEVDLKRIWKRAGLRTAPEGWTTPKIFIKQYGKKQD